MNHKLFSIIALSSMIWATGAHAKQRPFDTKFGAPTINGTANVIQPEIGDIILNSADGNFYGYNYNGSTSAWIQFLSSNGYTVPVISVFTTSGTYATPSPAPLYIRVTVVGGGGSGGGAATAAATAAAGSGGSGGGTAIKIITSPIGNYSYTVGAGGPSGTAGNNPGNVGTASNFNTTIIGGGGLAGNGSATASSPIVNAGSVAGGSASGGDINILGGAGAYSIILSSGSAISGSGGGTFLAGSTWTNQGTSATGHAGSGYGSGGSGGLQLNNGGAQQGGVGANGVVIVEAYYQ